MKMEKFAYIGCRTTKERKARGKGISVYKVDGDNFIFVTGKEKDHVLWVYAGSPEPIKPEDVPEFLK